jgi:hypothetical protein
MDKIKNKKWYFLFVFVIIAVAIGLRIYAANTLPVDDDEPAYLRNALEYNNYIRDGKLNMLAWSTTHYEHPAFYKLLYSIVLLDQPRLDKLYVKDFTDYSMIQTAGARQWAIVSRYLSVFFGGFTVIVLTLINPLAGFFLAVDTLAIRYTSEIYLEALPLLTSLLCALCYLFWYKQENKIKPSRRLWLALSSVFLGMTAASKYLYCVVGIAIMIHFGLGVFRKKVSPSFLLPIFLWGAVALLTFFVLDPYLWPHPITRLINSIFFNVKYSSSNWVKHYDFPFWQPLVWLSGPIYSTFTSWIRQSFIFQIDLLISLFALIGIPRLIKRNSFYFIWLVVALGFLFIWNTKWPQYTLILLIPLSVSAAEGVKWVTDGVRFAINRLTKRRTPI